MSPHTPESFNQTLLEAVSHMRDVTVRDGVQSWDANKWLITDIIPVVRELDKLAVLLKDEYGQRMNPTEVWGGGQVQQPAKFLKEDPLINLQEIHDAAPNMDLQCLYRGRQAFGFIPVSEEVQDAAIRAAVKRGMKLFRPFDMMNDIENLRPGIESMKRLKAEGQDIRIEGAISYISEPAGKRAWELSDYGQYAVDLAKLGCDEIAIKNYAGVGDKEMPDLVEAIHEALKTAGFPNMKVNLHNHGQKPETLLGALNAGADKVDVAYGDLSRGPAHTNAIDMLRIILEDKGYNVENGGEYHDAFEAHPIVKQMRAIEAVVNEHAKKYTPKRSEKLTTLTQDQMDHYRLAGGAFSDLSTNYMKTEDLFKVYHKLWMERNFGKRQAARANAAASGKEPPAMKKIPRTRDEWMVAVMEHCPALWEKAGRFNTVTPGSLILMKQAVEITNKELACEPIAMTDYKEEYLDIILGRYGRNQGLEKGIGDVKFRDAARMFRGLRVLNAAVDANQIAPGVLESFVTTALIADRSPIDFKNGKLRLENPNLVARLEHTSIASFQRAIHSLPSNVQRAMEHEMRIGRSPTPTDGLTEGRKQVDESGLLAQIPDSARITKEEAPLLMMLLRNRNTLGYDYSVGTNLLASKTGHSKSVTREDDPEQLPPVPAFITAAGQSTVNGFASQISMPAGSRPFTPATATINPSIADAAGLATAYLSDLEEAPERRGIQPRAKRDGSPVEIS